MRTRRMAPMVGLLCLALAACTTTSPGDPIPTPTSGSSITASTPPSGDEGDLPSNGAPKVKNPLKTDRFEQNPCLILTATQAKNLNLPTTGEPTDILHGVGCKWHNSDTRGEVIVGVLTDIDRGLSASYAANQRGDYPYFEKLPDIEGYPAVASDVEDRRPSGICVVDVGVTDQLVVYFALHLSQANVGQKDPCEWAAKVAGMALQTMKEGA